MPMAAFISYSHADEKAVEKLHKHLAMVQREGLLSVWYDQKILPGGVIDAEISQRVEKSGLFLALTSPDFLASNYCYENEFGRALARSAEARLRIVPVILEPCEWLASPLKQFKALPKDGKPISQWTNENIAYLDVVTGLRRLLSEGAGVMEVPDRPNAKGSPKVKIKRDFDSIQKSDFADNAFATIRAYFEASCAELSRVGDDLRAKFELMSDVSFSCTVVNRALTRGGEASITVHNLQGRPFGGDIIYAYSRRSEPNMSHGSIRVETNEYNMSLSIDFGTRGKAADYTAEQVAASLWLDFIKRAGIEYE